MISDNLQQVHDRIRAACHQAGRPEEEVTLLAVSKTFGADAVQQAFGAGQRVFGENYIQEAVEKITALRHLPIEWHCIGPVQSNKTRVVAAHFDWVHSVDRLKIAERLSEQRPLHLPPLQICIQVNVDAGANKSGVDATEALALAQAVVELPRLQLRGIMCIPEFTPNLIAQSDLFTRARGIFEQINEVLTARYEKNNPQVLFSLNTLSMGMTADLEAAIASGSTLVRVGTAIFGTRA